MTDEDMYDDPRGINIYKIPQEKKERVKDIHILIFTAIITIIMVSIAIKTYINIL